MVPLSTCINVICCGSAHTYVCKSKTHCKGTYNFNQKFKCWVLSTAIFLRTNDDNMWQKGWGISSFSLAQDWPSDTYCLFIYIVALFVHSIAKITYNFNAKCLQNTSDSQKGVLSRVVLLALFLAKEYRPILHAYFK